MITRICIIGATSAIAEAVAKEYAGHDTHFLLFGRDGQKLLMTKQRLENTGSKVQVIAMDFNDGAARAKIVPALRNELVTVDLVIVAHGILGADVGPLPETREVEELLTTNFSSAVLIITEIARMLRDQGFGTIVGISSVAGDRGRAKNLFYGSAKGGLSIFLQGLRQYLQPYGVHVLTVKPGFVDTPMTAHLRKSFLFASPALIARDIRRGIRKKKDTIYTPWFWRYIMLCICLLPEKVFKRMRF